MYDACEYLLCPRRCGTPAFEAARLQARARARAQWATIIGRFIICFALGMAAGVLLERYLRL